jgi:hypothetical protein
MDNQNPIYAELDLTQGENGDNQGNHWQEIGTFLTGTIAKVWGKTHYEYFKPSAIPSIMVSIQDKPNSTIAYFHVDKIVAKFAPGITFETDLSPKEPPKPIKDIPCPHVTNKPYYDALINEGDKVIDCYICALNDKPCVRIYGTGIKTGIKCDVYESIRKEAVSTT